MGTYGLPQFRDEFHDGFLLVQAQSRVTLLNIGAAWRLALKPSNLGVTAVWCGSRHRPDFHQQRGSVIRLGAIHALTRVRLQAESCGYGGLCIKYALSLTDAHFGNQGGNDIQQRYPAIGECAPAYQPLQQGEARLITGNLCPRWHRQGRQTDVPQFVLRYRRILKQSGQNLERLHGGSPVRKASFKLSSGLVRRKGGFITGKPRFHNGSAALAADPRQQTPFSFGTAASA